MKKVSALNAVLVLLLALLIVSCKRKEEYKFPFQNPALSYEERVKDLVSRMTLDEKILQMQFDAPAIERLGIPYYNWSGECLHGIVNEGGFATVFPQAIGMAATWDNELIQKEADVISTEARAWYYKCIRENNNKGVHKSLTFWSPNINIFRDPRWGRGQETYGEDPYLSGIIGTAFVKGLQGDDPTYFKTIATPKHYAVHSGPEPLRHKFNAETSTRDFYETYLPAFEMCIKEGKAFSVMGAYSAFLGIPCCASNFMLDSILRKDWGFQGYVVSDCGAIADIYTGHNYVKTEAEAAAVAVKAGTDITCGAEYSSLKKAVEDGLITEKEIDIAVSRLMMARFKLGMFDPQEMVPYSKVSDKDLEAKSHRDLANEVARKSIVLLKNQDNILPLNRDKIKSLAVIGPYIMRDDILYGNYSGKSSNPVTFLKGIQQKAGPGIKVLYTKGISPIDGGGALTTVETRYVKPPSGKGNGLLGEYFNNPDLKGKPSVSRIDQEMAPYFDKNAPAQGMNSDFFSVRWTGTITPPETGFYILGIITDDRGRLFFEDQMKVDNWNPFQKNVMKTFRTKLEKGKEYKIRIEYADSLDYAGIRFQWKKDSGDDETAENAELFAKALDIASQADVILFYGGISANLEGEEMSVELDGFKGGDRTSLDLPKDQLSLLKALKATGKPIVMVVTSGSPIALNWENENIPAILQAWYPGEEGGNAVADVLFGDYNPAGRLPLTFYRSVSDLPDFKNYYMQGRTYRYFNGSPLFPFGYGLSYSTFVYSGLKMDKTSVKPGETITISLNVKNTGAFDGDEVVQLYVRNLDSKEDQPLKSLRGFKRVHIVKNKDTNVELTLKINDLKYFSVLRNDFVVDPGRYEILIGSSSEDFRLKGMIRVN
jgi:beta-glucosidase